MNDVAATAAPAAEVPINSGDHAPQPLSNQAPTPERTAQPEAARTEAKAEPKPDAKPEVSKSAADAVKKANERFKAQQAADANQKQDTKPKAEVKPQPATEPRQENKTEASRDPSGRFASNQPKPDQAAVAQEQQARGQSEGSGNEAPARFNAQAKAEWANASESVRAETTRAIKELEDGHQKYKATHDRYEQLREFDDTARSNNRDLRESLQSIVQFENLMKSNPLQALDYALREAGPKKGDGSPFTLNDVVSHISGQSTDQRLQQASARINELESKIRDMETEKKIPQIIDKFKADHDRFDELTPVIIPLLKSGHSLDTAYELAVALQPQAAQPLIPAQQALAQTQTPQPKPANPAGQKSVSGSPSNGSHPAEKKDQVSLKDTPSIKDALRRASGLMS